jgi:hypothetical protein
MARHQHVMSFARAPQSNAWPQRGQRTLTTSCEEESDALMAK